LKGDSTGARRAVTMIRAAAHRPKRAGLFLRYFFQK
jgi:hypothetical protein